MKNSGLLKWTSNKMNSKLSKNASKNWIHPPDALQGGHIAYLVKYLGSTEVSQSKGIEVVKEAIQKLRFNQQIRKSEGTKIAKVELTISVDGVAVQQPKSKRVMAQYPLHRISYCADDKAEKKFFSFIAKESECETHTCYVFISDKLSEEITLTIGQAFDLAYKRFLETSTKEVGLRRQMINLQDELTRTQEQNVSLKQILAEASLLKDPAQLYAYFTSRKEEFALAEQNNINQETSTTVEVPPVPPRNLNHTSPLIEDLFMTPHEDHTPFDPRGNNANETTTDDEDEFEFNPRAFEQNKSIEPFQINLTPLNSNQSNSPPTILPPPPSGMKHHSSNKLLQTPNNKDQNDLLSQFDEMNLGFSHGLSFGTADVDFNLESLDPLKN